jgi:hypothetical protein
MAAEAGGGIHPAVDDVPGEIVSPVRHAAEIVCLVLEGRLEFHPGGVAVVAEARVMAHGTELLVLVGLLPMAVGEVDGVVVTRIVQGFTAGVMAFGAGRPFPCSSASGCFTGNSIPPFREAQAASRARQSKGTTTG